jgi:siderophore synthetase component
MRAKDLDQDMWERKRNMPTLQQESPVSSQRRFSRIYNRFLLPIDEEAEPAIDELPTTIMPAVHVEEPKEEQDTLPLDAEGRPFLQVCDPIAATFVLVQELVSLIHGLTGEYPEAIVLNKDRWGFTGEELQQYVPESGIEIPYRYEGEKGYDVLVRGRRPSLD